MNETPHFDRRTPVHLPVFDIGNRANIIFVTVCTHDRARILATPDMHVLILKAWASRPEWVVGRYVIMPDHLHLFCSPVGLEHPHLVRWISGWKAYVSRRWPKPKSKSVWQRSFWDRQLRRGDSYSAKWEYVRNNPVRHDLVPSSVLWPYQGEVTHLRWHDE